MSSSGNSESVNATKDTSSKPVKSSDPLPAEGADSSERVGELFNLALGGGADAPPKGDIQERVEEPNDLAVGASSITPLSPNRGPDRGNVGRKMLTTHRKLIIELTKLSRELDSCSTLEQFNDYSVKFDALQSACNDFQCDLKLVKDPSDLIQLNDRVPDLYKECHMLHKQCERHFLDEMRWYDCENTIEPSDSVSQTTKRTSSSASKLKEQQIDLDEKRAELNAAFELAKAREVKVLADAEIAETLAKLRLEEAKINAEQRRIACSQRGSSVTASSRSRVSSRRKAGSEKKQSSKAELNLNARSSKLHGISIPRSNVDQHKKDASTIRTEQWVNSLTTCDERNVNYNEIEDTVPKTVIAPSNSLPSVQAHSAVHQYLERQGRNEFINLASQIAYNGNNIAFIFYENQIRKLMHESPLEERRLEVLRASCVGQPREMVNLFFAPLKGMTTGQRIEKALERLRQRYGVSGGFASEPKVVEIRFGPKVVHTAMSLKAFNEDLDTLEVFAYAHDQIDKLSGQLLLDTANRLPGNLKRRYLDFLDRTCIDLNQPNVEGFNSLRKFIVHEIELMTSDYAQALFKSDGKDKPKDFGNGRGAVRVRQTAFTASNENHVATERHVSVASTKAPTNKRSSNQSLPKCFVCSDRHYLLDCDKFNALSDHLKRQTVLDSGRCFNCLSLGHNVRNCGFPCKCRKCNPNHRTKHATALHNCLRLAPAEGSGAEEVTPPFVAQQGDAEQAESTVVRKVDSVDRRVVLLRTCAVRVLNPDTGKSTLAYAQLDTASQATLISESLCEELDLKRNVNSSTLIRTLAEDTLRCNKHSDFKLESLSSGERFEIKNALVVKNFVDDENTLPHRVDISRLQHFAGVKIPTLPDRKSVDILVGQSDKVLLTVLAEREGLDPDEPNYVLTRLGPVVSGGRLGTCQDLLQNRRVEIERCPCDPRTWDELKQENAFLKNRLKEFETYDEIIQPSINDELAKELVESNIKVVNGRYEIPVPLRQDVVQNLPSNYGYALKRFNSMKTSAARNPKIKLTLLNTFRELIDEGWIVPVPTDEHASNKPLWYLPYFVTRQEKARVVYDGSATVSGASLNDAVLSGANLLNDLVEVLIRFRLGKYACMADLSKCFFQVAMPVEQRDLFRIIWCKNSDFEGGEPQMFQFTRHVWGMNSSPYVILCAIKQLILENPTQAGEKTLAAIDENRYMDDVLFSCDSLSELEIVSRESDLIFQSRGFKLRKWVTNACASSILAEVPKCDLAANISEIAIGLEPMPDSKALGVIWDVENDKLKVSYDKEFVDITTRRQMASQLASNFDPLGVVSPCLLGGKLILQRVATAKYDWDDKLPDNIISDWNAWIVSLKTLSSVSIDRYCFVNHDVPSKDDNENYQLHGFCDASNKAFSGVVYLRRIVNGHVSLSFILGKSRVVLQHQSNWVISRKELEAAKLCSELMLVARKALRNLSCCFKFWTDSQVVHKWITNPELRVAGFVKRRVDKIFLASSPDAWGYVSTALNPADATGLDLNNFLLAFSRFTNLRGHVETIYSDNGSTFCAAADVLPKLLDSPEFINSTRKRGINWVRIPPYAPSQGGSWESMVKLFKNALCQVVGRARRKPTLIELQTFTLDAVRIVNDRPLTTPSDQPNDLLPITPSCFLGQQLAPNSPLGSFHDKGDLRRDYLYNTTLAHQFWLSWAKSYLINLQGRGKWRAVRENLYPGQLVLVGDTEDIAKRGAYRIGRIHRVHPQIRKGREIVRRATVAVLAKTSAGGSGRIEYVLRDISKIAPV